MKCIALLTCVVLLAGCDLFNQPIAQPKPVSFTVHLRVDPNLNEMGLAIPGDKHCSITLREYPICLQHEIRHCVEGQWHPGRDTVEDC